MIVYKTTMIKFLKSPSTYIPLVLTLLIALTIGVVLPFWFLDLKNPNVNRIYIDFVYSSVITIAPATTLVSASFVAYKAIQIYKQEIEDGSFLVLISKPISRSKILIQKWMAMICLILSYIFIIMFFYAISVYIFDPGDKLENLAMQPLKDNIWIVALILAMIIFVLSFFFSSIAMLLSTKFSSIATIATITAIGAVIPVSALIPTFTNSPEHELISNPNSLSFGSRDISKSGFDAVAEILNKKRNNLEYSNFLKLQKKLDDFSYEIDKNASEKLIKNITIRSGKTNSYKHIYGFDLNYQLSMISSIALEPMINERDKQIMAISQMTANFQSSPSMSGKVNVIHSEIGIADITRRVLNTLKMYEKLISSPEFDAVIYPCFDYILRGRNVAGINEPTNDKNFDEHFKKLMAKLGEGGIPRIQSFVSSPLYKTLITYDQNIDQDTKDRLKTDANLRFSLVYLQQLISAKILFKLGYGIDLLINNYAISKFFLENKQERVSTIKDLEKFDKEHPELAASNEYKELQEKYLKNPFEYTENNTTYGKEAQIHFANLLQISDPDISPGGISIINFTDFANKWTLLTVYTVTAILLCPITFYIILRQNIK